MGVAIAGTISLFHADMAFAEGSSGIRPFRVEFPEELLLDLRRRINATRWPDRETVSDQSQGIQLAKLQPLMRYWGTEYDWRKIEAVMNALPQFVTEIDGIDIHFIHVRSKHPNALPVIITHGWPGSVLEQLKVIGPLTDPTAHGGRREDAFDVVIPSMPGYGFSGKPTGTGWGPDHIARIWAELMKRIGYNNYVAQGGDWGSPVSSAMARLAPAGLLGIHKTTSTEFGEPSTTVTGPRCTSSMRGVAFDITTLAKAHTSSRKSSSRTCWLKRAPLISTECLYLSQRAAWKRPLIGPACSPARTMSGTNAPRTLHRPAGWS